MFEVNGESGYKTITLDRGYSLDILGRQFPSVWLNTPDDGTYEFSPEQIEDLAAAMMEAARIAREGSKN